MATTTKLTKCDGCGERFAPKDIRRVTLTDGDGTVLDTAIGCIDCARTLTIEGTDSQCLEGEGVER